MKLNHKKKRNTGLLFDLLAQQMTNELMNSTSITESEESPASKLLNKYFLKSELGKELKLYKKLIESKNLSEREASELLKTVVESSQRLDRNKLEKIKHNLCGEIAESYDEKKLFTKVIPSYRELASVYKLFEYYNSNHEIDVKEVVDNKMTILEHLTNTKNGEGVEKDIIEEFRNADPELRALAYKISLDKFNDKYSKVNNYQKQFLNEFIKCDNSIVSLREMYNRHASFVKEQLSVYSEKVESDVTKVFLEEAVKSISILKTKKTKNKNFENLLQYYEVLDKIEKIHA
jgi:hypothetical protein